jgi:predicted nuclease of predicted toxin-antitoxin system
MRFLVDECTGSIVARWLRDQGHDVFSVYDDARGLEDEPILDQACAEERILITCDKDFGELVFREGLPHRGILLLRLDNPEPGKLIAAVQRALASHSDQLAGNFVVVTRHKIRLVED